MSGRVVIVGGGFAGFWAAVAARRVAPPVEISLISRRPVLESGRGSRRLTRGLCKSSWRHCWSGSTSTSLAARESHSIRTRALSPSPTDESFPSRASSSRPGARGDLFDLPTVPYVQPAHITCFDLGRSGAVFTRGWKRTVDITGAEAKAIKRRINTQVIYPPADATRDELHTVSSFDLSLQRRKPKTA